MVYILSRIFNVIGDATDISGCMDEVKTILITHAAKPSTVRKPVLMCDA